MKFDARYVALAVSVCVAVALFVTWASPELFAVDSTKYRDVTLGLGLIAVGLCLPGAMLATKAGREAAHRYFGGPTVLGAVLAGLVVVGGYLVVYGRAGLQGLFGI